jgi:hypothetical protein
MTPKQAEAYRDALEAWGWPCFAPMSGAEVLAAKDFAKAAPHLPEVKALESDLQRWKNAYDIAHDQASSNGAELVRLRAKLAMAETELTRLRARVAELEAMQQWQPIETAPRDGSYILAARFKNGDEFLWAKHSRWMTAEEIAEIEGGAPDQWCANWQDGDNEAEPCFPTHWMPLLTPPEASHD